MIQLQLQPDIEAQLAAEVETVGLPIETLIQIIVTERLAHENLLEQADALEGIRRGLADADAGRTRPAREFFAEFRQKHGIPD